MSQTAVSKTSKYWVEGRLLLSWQSKEDTQDVTDSEVWGFNALAEDGERAAETLEEFKNRLGLLRAAASGTDLLEARHVRTVVDDLLRKLEDGEDLPSYIGRTGELFENAKPMLSGVKP